ncbi:MAG: hypothetical protein VX871_01510 [Pseudomonadota bacterium]|nr:hypothetical protein [Pseudomonadota bacterium]
MASRRGAAAIRAITRAMLFLLAATSVAAMGGCASGSLSSVFSGSSTGGKAAPAPVSFGPIIGPPQAVSQQISGQVVTAAQQKNIPVVTGTTGADYTVRGYLDASPDRAGNKLAFIWDVLDKDGKRVHRIVGEEVVPAKAGTDPWKTVDQSAIDKIANRTATDLAAWLPQKTGSAAPAVADSSVRTDTPSERPRTASLEQSNEIKVLVAPVTGAPGDGQKSLTLALKKQLFKRGMKLTSASGPGVYTIKGKVSVASAGNGQQDVKIDWQVFDPKGKELPTVSQSGRTAQGSLDKEWGPAADAAAGDAANEIAKLIPKS